MTVLSALRCYGATDATQVHVRYETKLICHHTFHAGNYNSIRYRRRRCGNAVAVIAAAPETLKYLRQYLFAYCIAITHLYLLK